MSGKIQTLIKSKKWQDPSKFRIALTGPGASLLNIDPETLSLSLSNIQLPEMQGTPIEQYIAEEWRFATGRLEAFNVSLTFKDFNNFEMYKKWVDASIEFVRYYPDEQKINIEIHTSDDFDIANMKKLVTFRDCILMGVGGPTLDNSAIASIAEFNVTLKSSYIE